MSPYVKQILFIVTGIFLVGLVGVYNETAQRLLGLVRIWVDVIRHRPCCISLRFKITQE